MQFEFDPSLTQMQSRAFTNAKIHMTSTSVEADRHFGSHTLPIASSAEHFLCCRPLGVSHVELHDLIHLECPKCHFDFTRQAHKLLCAWAAAG